MYQPGPWAKICSSLLTHPKFVGLSDAAKALWLMGLLHAVHYRTNGDLEPTVVRRLGARRAIGELVQRKLWEPAAGGYRIHDYLDYQPDAEGNLPRSRLSQVRAAAGQKGADRRWGDSKGDGKHGKRHGKPGDLPMANRGESDGKSGGLPLANSRSDLPIFRSSERDKSKPQRDLEPVSPIFAAVRDALKTRKGPT